MYFLKSGCSFVRFLLLLIAGILCADFLEAQIFYVGISLSFLVFIFLFFVKIKNKINDVMVAITVYTFLFFTGIILVQHKKEYNRDEHYSNYLCQMKGYVGEIVSEPERKSSSIKMILTIKKIKLKNDEWLTAYGDVLVYILRNHEVEIKMGDVLYLNACPEVVSEPLNPLQFNFKTYLERQNIYASHFIFKNQYCKIGENNYSSVIRLSNSIRTFCESKFKEKIKNEREAGLAIALLLGVKTSLDKQVLEAYSEAGVVHALAVSGLHVSLIFFMIVFLFDFIKRRKKGRVFFAGIAISVLWLYAFVTGLSPSVVRAVTMFTLYLIANVFKRNTSIYNILAFSAMLILCINPFLIYDIGFQFSFLAVCGIAYFSPFLNSIFEFRNKYIQKVWSLSVVSIAAQLAVFPLSVYYFHNFPLLFLPFNLVVIPLSTLALYAGVAGLILCKIEFISDLLFLIMDYLLQWMNIFVLSGQNIEWVNLNFLSLNLVQVILLYIFIVLFFLVFKYKSYLCLKLSMVVIVVFVIIHSLELVDLGKRSAFCLYTIKGKTMAAFVKNRNVVLLSDFKSSEKDIDFKNNAYNHLASLNLRNVTFESFSETENIIVKKMPLGQLIVWDGLKILRITKKYLTKNDLKLLNKVVCKLNFIVVSNAKNGKVEDALVGITKNLDVKIIIEGLSHTKTMNAHNVHRMSVQGAFICNNQ